MTLREAMACTPPQLRLQAAAQRRLHSRRLLDLLAVVTQSVAVCQHRGNRASWERLRRKIEEMGE